MGNGILDGMRVGIAHHFGWAVAVTASTDYKVVDRRRIELIEPGMAAAPIHHEGKALDDAATAALVVRVRASAVRATSGSLEELATAVPEPIVSMSLRAWPAPTKVARNSGLMIAPSIAWKAPTKVPSSTPYSGLEPVEQLGRRAPATDRHLLVLRSADDAAHPALDATYAEACEVEHAGTRPSLVDSLA
jgi:hypothetical protein